MIAHTQLMLALVAPVVVAALQIRAELEQPGPQILAVAEVVAVLLLVLLQRAQAETEALALSLFAP
jgi:DNA repair protein RadC